MLTLDQVSELSGVSAQTLRNRIASGAIVPAQPGGKGRANHHQFSVTQAVGIVVAEELQRTERGCSIEYVTAVVAAFGSVTEQWLEKRLERDGRWLAAIHQGKPLLRNETHAKEWGWPDVKAAYERVLKCEEAK